MQAKSFATLILLACAGTAALADDPTPQPATMPSMLTRAEVHAEVLKARAAGTLVSGGDILRAGAMEMGGMPLTREQVRAELRAAGRQPQRNSNYQPS